MSPQEFAVNVGDLHTKVAVLEERTKSYATATQLAEAQRSIEGRLTDAQRSIESKLSGLSEQVLRLHADVGIVKSDIAHMASRAWVLSGAIGAVVAVLAAIWAMLSPHVGNLLMR